ncbi:MULTISPECIES: ATP phosphoribosyltransferase regulatory subunit [Vitreoscilla]|uniref:ATP phosphoribosyltransferase regulatory subunit n=1 Tax=Vitreoscilla stercoraria TaxID=61 RepID=A0ABY4E9K2_VITST|nr:MULTISPECIES: ATP phosphoribosyltransferase regulatory subunit [Vitreoscilla]AUZ03981.1 ATP phosphoribosyltransferase regulatory subunit [Vitreoscilla sp. C1]UOO92099.1 ATP phosphoribosyltransferase regulatory subunit [Vitreoscilla stercoraria]
MQSWQLPEYIADILPSTARQLESAKEALLGLFRVHGYELVSPPLLEYTSSLLLDIDDGLALKTIRIVDQISGRQLGLRADITPQVARIDAHLLSANDGINRLCYAGSVIHARPDSLLSTREPLQVGAELYGYEGIEADVEIIDLMLKTLKLAHAKNVYLSLGHVGIFQALADKAQLTVAQSRELLSLMKDKDSEAVLAAMAGWDIDTIWKQTFAVLPTLYGDVETVLSRAKTELPAIKGVQDALDALKTICKQFKEYKVHIDLSILRNDSYHTGLLFAAYAPGWSDALARGGRYDGLGHQFGRARPATGFSLDLRDLIEVLPQKPAKQGIKVAAQWAVDAKAFMDELRAQGEVVVIDYVGDDANTLHCDRELVLKDGAWMTVPCNC